MVGLRANDIFLDLPEDLKLTITSECPVFDREGIDRTYTLPFRLFPTPTNLAVLGQFTRIDGVVSKSIPARLYIEGQEYGNGMGRLKLVSRSEDSGEFVFQNTHITVSEQLEKTNLRDLDVVEELADPWNLELVLSAETRTPQPNDPLSNVYPKVYAISVNGIQYFYPLGALNQLALAINTDFPGLITNHETTRVLDRDIYRLYVDIQAVQPLDFQLIISHPTRPLTELLYFFVHSSTEKSEAIRTTDELSILAAEGGTEKVRFPVVRAPNFYDGKNDRYSTYLNYVSAVGDHPTDAHLPVNPSYLEGTEYEVVGHTIDGWKHTLVPFPTIGWIFEGIVSSGAISRVFGSWTEATEMQQILQWQNRSLDRVMQRSDYSGQTSIYDPHYRGYEPVLRLGDFLPDLSAREWLRRLVNTFCLYMVAEGSGLRIEAVRDRLRDLPMDWTEYAEIGYKVQEEDYDGHTLDYDRPNDEQPVAGQLSRVPGGKDALEITAEFFSLYERSEEDAEDAGRFWRTPVISESGKNKYYALDQEASLRIFFFRGMQPDNEGNTYPLAAHSRKNFLAENVGNHSLDWKAEGGLYEWWKDYISLREIGKQVRLKFRLPISTIMELQDWRRIVISTRGEHGQMRGAIRSFQFQASASGISSTEVTLEKMD